MGTQDQSPVPAASRPLPDIPPASMRTELEKQRQAAARLLGDMAAAIARNATHVGRGAQSAARRTGHAAQFVQERYVRDWASGVRGFVHRHPASSVAAVMLAGYLVGRAFRRR